MPSQNEIQQSITDRIIQGLSLGTVPWRKPWRNDPNSGPPTNVVSRKAYSGINPLLLDLVGISRGYQSRWWGTFEQWKSLGASVRKRPADVEPGQWGTSIVFWKQIEKTKQDASGEEQKTRFPMLRNFTVFNLEQVEGAKVDQLRPSLEVKPSPCEADFIQAHRALLATKADIRYGGNKAFYVRPEGAFPNHVGGDYICLPSPSQFNALHERYATTMHELVHWSEVRLGWTGSYAMGELIAEIGAAFLCAQLGIPCSEDLTNHTAYLACWLKELKTNGRAILKAASQASKAAKLILDFSLPSEENQPSEQSRTEVVEAQELQMS